MLSISLNRRSVEAVVVAKLKFGGVARHVRLTGLVERADNAMLDDRPEAGVFALCLVNRGVMIIAVFMKKPEAAR
jgi:hypothetical protein